MPSVNVDAIPSCLKELPQWVCWKYVERAGKRTKCPVQPANGHNASVSEPATWTSFAHAVAAMDHYDGIAFIFTESDPYCGIDLDDCLDEQGQLAWAGDLVERFDSYTEISPSGRGLKMILRGSKPPFARCKANWRGQGTIEVYDEKRLFALTGQRLEGGNGAIAGRQAELNEVCTELWPPAVASAHSSTDDRVARGLQSMLRLQVDDHQDGSHRLYTACCRAIEHDLTDTEALACLHDYARYRPFPQSWSDDDLSKRLRDAERVCQRGIANQSAPQVRIEIPTFGELYARYPELNPPVIHGLLRRQETMNVIATSKGGKTWLVHDLVLSLATGRPWLGLFDTEPGKVLLVDNELHPSLIRYRIDKVALAKGVYLDEIASTLSVVCLRGRLLDVYEMARIFEQIEPGRFQAVVIDATYRALPRDVDENSNSALAGVYNAIDGYAERLRSAFALVHHSSKGSQSGKQVTDVGAGAGSQSRATDTHLILRPHAEPQCVVLEAAVRSWPPLQPRVLRWQFPLWSPDDNLHPGDLLSDKPQRREPPPKQEASEEPVVKSEKWTTTRFVEAFVSAQPQSREVIIARGDEEANISERRVLRLLKSAEARRLIHRWRRGDRMIEYATVPMPPGESKTERVRLLLATTPDISSREVEEQTGASRTLVNRVRQELRGAATTPATTMTTVPATTCS